MLYLITVADDGMILERMLFSYRDEALYFAEVRRKQGYTVTVKHFTTNEEDK